MKYSSSASVIQALSIASVACAFLACSSSDDNSSNVPAAGAGTGGGAGTSAMAGAAGNGTSGGGTTGVAGSGTGGMAAGSGGMVAVAGSGGSAGAGGAAPSTAGTWMETPIPLANGVFSFGDGTSTMLLTAPAANQVCLNGLAAAAGADYALWGAGLGIQMAKTTPQGVVTEAFDAVAYGATQIRFTLSTVPTTGVRVGITMSNDGALLFQENPFIASGAASGDIKVDGTVTLPLTDFEQPSWGLVGEVLDPSALYGLQFQVVTVAAMTVPYSFCVSDVAWLDADGNVVDDVPDADAGAPDSDAGMSDAGVGSDASDAG